MKNREREKNDRKCKGKNNKGKSKIGKKEKDDISGGNFFFLLQFTLMLLFGPIPIPFTTTISIYFPFVFTYYRSFILLFICISFIPLSIVPFSTSPYPSLVTPLIYSPVFYWFDIPVSSSFSYVYQFFLSSDSLFHSASLFPFLSLPTLHQLPFTFTLPSSSFDNPVTSFFWSFFNFLTSYFGNFGLCLFAPLFICFPIP